MADNNSKKNGGTWTYSLKDAKARLYADHTRAEKIFFTALQAMALSLVFLFTVQLAKTDYSLRQNEDNIHVGIIFANADDIFWRSVENEWRSNAAANAQITFTFRRAESYDDCLGIAADLLNASAKSSLKIGNKPPIRLLIITSNNQYAPEIAAIEQLCHKTGVSFMPLIKPITSADAKAFADKAIHDAKQTNTAYVNHPGATP